MSDKIIIEVNTGMVTAVWSSNPEIEVRIVDWDNAANGDEEIQALAEDDIAYQNLIAGMYEVA